ncbi:hypothetical protein BGX23_005467 [Mortierella sp. AD031]|nr:hypothetical protein BGX23_005467 [Mortierella sp. AD031]KAG0217691.1 hypothetical protein BGX33_009832 [Mortierella sp. NVP41]
MSTHILTFISPTSIASTAPTTTPHRPPQCCYDPYTLYHERALDLNRALFKFLNYSAARISAEIADAWSKEPHHVKQEYETQALREREAFEASCPDYRYKKSTTST